MYLSIQLLYLSFNIPSKRLPVGKIYYLLFGRKNTYPYDYHLAK